MICDACFGNEYKKPKMIFLGWGSGTVCPECYEYIKKVKKWFVNDATNTLGQTIAFMDTANIACLYCKENGGHYNAENRSN